MCSKLVETEEAKTIQKGGMSRDAYCQTFTETTARDHQHMGAVMVLLSFHGAMLPA